MDWRVLVVLLPLLVAGSWAIFNIGVVALRQLQQFTNKSS